MTMRQQNTDTLEVGAMTGHKRMHDSAPVAEPFTAAKSGLEVRQVRAFVALAETGSMTAAARTLGVAQSTVSEAIFSLERALGAQVVLRRQGSHDATLTEVGNTFLPHARRVLAVVDGAHAAVAGASKTARGTVEIVANESISTYILPPVLSQLRDRWPNTRFLVSVAACQGIPNGMVNGTFDVGLLIEFEEVRTLKKLAGRSRVHRSGRRVIASAVPLVAFVARSHPLLLDPVRRAVTREAWTEYPLFVSDAAGDFHAWLTRILKSNGGLRTRMESTGSVEGVKTAVMARPAAIGFLPAYALEKEVRDGSIAVLDPRPSLPPLRVDAFVSPTRVRHPATDDLLETLVAKFA
jgi:DNA-binding transcriptional LysR family regulator